MSGYTECWAVVNGALVRRSRSYATPPPSPSPLPTGAGYSAWTDLAAPGDTIRKVLAKVPAGNVLTLPSGTYEFADFNDQSSTYGLLIPDNCAGIYGSGRDTILRMTQGSSTVGGNVPTAAGTTNPYRLIGVKHSNVLIKNLQIQGTQQGHYYGGINFSGSSSSPITGCTMDNVYMIGASPGNASAPPGETFSIGTNHADNTQILNCEIDGRDPVSGATTCSSLIGWNNSANAYVQDTYCHHSGYGHGATFWKTDGVHTLRLRCEYNGLMGVGGHCINHENVSGTVLHESPTLTIGRASGSHGKHITIQESSADGYSNNPSVSLTSITHDAGPSNACFSVLIGDSYNGSTQVQTSMPTVTKNGVTLTARDINVSSTNPDPSTQFFRYH